MVELSLVELSEAGCSSEVVVDWLWIGQRSRKRRFLGIYPTSNTNPKLEKQL
ncbi:hypothetical protein CROQUDRAFT_660225 [Cronartium quercuum f. sp. fusiforme G11]|uniref:Uncharacterized protein n=1 Tax=Cronartium quercuum f. sp. fusiforme G11 TaxID=708437 RepID=A0A9P6TA40_9BASI|nr:hypothetical protein CROQUDRAFT_660225 [Cronartium quercuum f. sp. fusiforme G11]